MIHAHENVQPMLFSSLTPAIRPGKRDIVPFTLEKKQRVTFAQLMDFAPDALQISKGDLVSWVRRRSIARPRQVFMYVAYQDTKFSYPEIGRRLGTRDHTTILHGYKVISAKESDDDIYAMVAALRGRYFVPEAQQ